MITSFHKTSKLIEDACNKYFVNKEDIFKYKVSIDISKAQRMIIKGLRERGYSYSRIGRIMKRNFSTIYRMHNRKRKRK